jgi:hypothetical protein
VATSLIPISVGVVAEDGRRREGRFSLSLLIRSIVVRRGNIRRRIYVVDIYGLGRRR